MHEPSHPVRPPVLYQRDALWNVRDLRLFETVTPRELRKLKPLFQVRHCRQGEFLFHVGDAAKLLYFVERGAIKVSYHFVRRAMSISWIFLNRATSSANSS